MAEDEAAAGREVEPARADEGLVRFGVSIERDLLERFDSLRLQRGYATRSEALRDLIRDHLTQQGWQGEAGWICGSVTLVYPHDRIAVSRALAELQHSALDLIVSTLHVHLDRQRCMEVLVLRGPADRVRSLAEQVGALRGLAHGHVSLVAAEALPRAGTHHHHGDEDESAGPHASQSPSPTTEAP
jgi:CopG family nickel-responsive transcriptional regulator